MFAYSADEIPQHAVRPAQRAEHAQPLPATLLCHPDVEAVRHAQQQQPVNFQQWHTGHSQRPQRGTGKTSSGTLVTRNDPNVAQARAHAH